MTDTRISFAQRTAVKRGPVVNSSVLHQSAWSEYDADKHGILMRVSINSGNESLTPKLAESLLMPLLAKHFDLNAQDMAGFGSKQHNGTCSATEFVNMDAYNAKVAPVLANVRRSTVTER
jgi:hypothetical protein